MKKGILVLIVIVAIIGLIVFMGVGTYNRLVTKSEEVDNKFSDINVMLQRRADLIPNLVNTVKGFASHEQEIIDSVTNARAKLIGANTIEEKAGANDELTGALNRLLVVVENYPEIKSSANFTQLSDELAGTENRISTSRRDYNEAVKEFNADIKKFPTNMLAGMFGMEAKEYFEAKEGVDNVPSVEF